MMSLKIQLQLMDGVALGCAGGVQALTVETLAAVNVVVRVNLASHVVVAQLVGSDA